MRPKGGINDFVEYVYVIDLKLNDFDEAAWRVECYRVKRLKEADSVGEDDLELEASFSAAFKLSGKKVEVQLI